mgnify:CR=1 FL=1
MFPSNPWQNGRMSLSSTWSPSSPLDPPLQKGGVLTSQRGTQGGYRLACPASELSVYEIVRLTEGSLAPVTCLEDFDPSVGCVCSRAGVCLTLPLWQGLERRVVEYLSGVTIQDLLDGRALDQ